MIMCLFCYLEQFNYSPKPIPGGMWGTCFVCNFRKPMYNLGSENVEKKTEKVFDIARRKILLTQKKNICCLKWRPSRWLNAFYLKQISMYEYIYFVCKIDNISWTKRDRTNPQKMIMTLMRSSNVLQSDYRSGRVYFDCRSHQNQETPANPLPRIGLQYAPTFYIFFIFCIIRYDSDTLYTVTLARIWGGGECHPSGGFHSWIPLCFR